MRGHEAVGGEKPAAGESLMPRIHLSPSGTEEAGFTETFAVAVERLVIPMFVRAVERLVRLGIDAQLASTADSNPCPGVCLCLGADDPATQSRYCITADAPHRRVVYRQFLHGPPPYSSRLETELAGLNETLLNTELGLFIRRSTGRVVDLLAGHTAGFWSCDLGDSMQAIARADGWSKLAAAV